MVAVLTPVSPILVTNAEDNVNRGIEVFGNVDEYKKGYVKIWKACGEWEFYCVIYDQSC